MLDFLNENIGVEEATYIGMFLAVIALFFGAKKIMNSKNQSQKGGRNSTNIQIGGSLNINGKKEDE